MGQLEKYGLYVLCLVIFLILGVTIWGGGDVPPPQQRRQVAGTGSELNANQRAGNGGTVSPNLGGAAGNRVAGTQPAAIPDLDSLLSPVKAPDAKKPEPKPDAGGGGGNKTADAGKPPADATKPPVAEPGKTPADAPRPTHKVQRGDTFDSIAKEKLGSANLRTEIARLNPRVDPSRLQIDQELTLPSADEVAAFASKSKGKAVPADASAPAVKPGKPAAEAGSYTVAKGDTFESIARRELGSSKRVREVRDLNPTVDPTRLKVGMTIRLPAK